MEKKTELAKLVEALGKFGMGKKRPLPVVTMGGAR
jgi:hypothetical protein